MVMRYTLTAPPDGSPPRFNIAPLQHALITTAGGLESRRWGLLPPWRGHGGKRDPHVISATAAQLESTPLLRDAFKRDRGLVAADGFYAWHPPDRRTQPLWIRVPDPDDRPGARPDARPDARPRLLGFAAVAATRRDDGQPSFALVVAPVQLALAGATIEVEAPIAIDPADHRTWLEGSVAAARALLVHRPIGWRPEPVSTYVNSVEHDDARCIAPLRDPRQGQLF